MCNWMNSDIIAGLLSTYRLLFVHNINFQYKMFFLSSVWHIASLLSTYRLLFVHNINFQYKMFFLSSIWLLASLLSTYRLLFVHSTNFQYKMFISSIIWLIYHCFQVTLQFSITFYHSQYCKLGGGMGTMLRVVHNCFNLTYPCTPLTSLAWFV